MTKIDKTDLENIKLITNESKISSVAKIKIKKNDYEIEITSIDFTKKNVSDKKFEKNTEIKEDKNIKQNKEKYEKYKMCLKTNTNKYKNLEHIIV